jgi:serine/threonine protein kinase
VEDRALVMELVDGPTLAERIAQGPIPLEEALPIARQIAEALEYAHERNIVHRDLKPANIKVTPEGRVKVLDFGLAKAMTAEARPGDPASSPTLTMSSTQMGVLLGTAAYMSPEQAKGKTVDKRADIWAFGVVLIEMLTGRQLYGGETLSDTLAAVLLKEPELDGLPGDTPPDIRRLLRRCLVKDARQRLRDIGDARIVIDECLANPGAEEAEVKTAPFDKKPGLWIGAAGLLAIALAALSLVHFREKPVELSVLRFTLGPPDGAAFGHTFGLVSAFALSPDGQRLAFVAHSASGKDELWVHSLSTFTAQPLPGTEGASYPFWSPDSRFIGFGGDGKLKKIDANGGPAVTLAPAANLRGGTWNGDVILFAVLGGPLQRVSSAGGASSPVTRFDESKKERDHRFPWFLPDGRHFLCRVLGDGQTPNIRIGSLDSVDTKPLLQADSNAIYASGYVLYLRESNLMAQPFDPKRLTTTGDAVPIAEKVGSIYGSGAFGIFSTSANGVLAYVSGESGALGLTWLDRTGKHLGNVGDPGLLGRIRISPDGRSAALSSSPGGNQDIWIYDLERRLPRRFTVDPAREMDAIWSPDGRTVVFNSARKGPFDLYRKNADGTGAEELLYADDISKTPSSWSPDGRVLLYTATGTKTSPDIWVLPMTQQSGAPAKPYAWLQTQFAELEAVFSPDGKWVAYQSNESGNMEIYVAAFPGPGGKRRVSTAGGGLPRWSPEGKEIFYVGGASTLMAVPVAAKGATMDIGEPQRLFGFPPTGVGVIYDVSARGRILAALPPEESGKTPNEVLKFVQNWTAELKK